MPKPKIYPLMIKRQQRRSASSRSLWRAGVCGAALLIFYGVALFSVFSPKAAGFGLGSLTGQLLMLVLIKGPAWIKSVDEIEAVYSSTNLSAVADPEETK